MLTRDDILLAANSTNHNLYGYAYNIARVLNTKGYDTFEYINSGSYSDVYRIGKGHVLRITSDTPIVFPEHIQFNPRLEQPFKFENCGLYFEIFKELTPLSRLDGGEFVVVERSPSIEELYNNSYVEVYDGAAKVYDVRRPNVGVDEAGIPWIIDAGCIKELDGELPDHLYEPVVLLRNHQLRVIPEIWGKEERKEELDEVCF